MSDWFSKKVVVTGAGGFIGSHLTEKLVEMGADVTALIHYNSGNHWGNLEYVPKDILKEIKVVSGNIEDPYFLQHHLIKGQEIVFHLASLIAIPYSYRAPLSYVRTNVEGTLNVIEASLRNDVQKVVHTSTSEVYGTARFVPIVEEHPLQGQSPYSASKIGADQVAMSYFNAFGLPLAIIRPFNTYGPRQSARAVIPTIITQIASGKRTIELGSLTPTRDFNYVQDTVRGFIAIAESDKSAGQIINIGSGYEISVGDTAALIAEVMGVEIQIVTDAKRLRPEKSEVERLWADNSKAQILLGWEPLFGGKDGLKRGLEETAKWFTQPEYLKNYKSGFYNI